MKQTNTNIHWAFLALLLGLLWMPNAATAQEPVIEDGTEEHPFLIESEQELWDFHDCMVPGNDFYFVKASGTYTMTRPSSGREGTDFFKILTGCKNTYIKLTTDIVINRGNVAGCDGVKDPSWKAWTPMEVFTGHFDGDYHIVSGLYCTERERATNGRNERGFFTQASDTSTIKNLGITNSYIAGAKSVGGICGWLLEGSSIDGCFFEGTLEATDINAGGIVGICESNASVSNCYSTGQVFSTSRHVGGIVGENSGGSTITNCYTNMMLQSEGPQTAAVCGFDNAGGPVTNCYYDKQLSTLNTNDLATGVLTSTMISGSWNILGNRFSYENGLYPYITGFSLDKPSVAMSVMPFILNAISDVQYDDVSNLNADFTLGSRPGATWAVDSWNDCLTADLDHATVSVHKEGIADLRVQMDTLTRTFVLFPHKAPLLGSEENPFIIENLDNLTAFRDGINSGSDFVFRRVNVNYNNIENIHWKQVNDIDMSSVPNWTPIGTSELPFKGYYDGGNHEIVHLTFTSGENKALFGYSRGDIRNLGIRDAYFSVSSGAALLAVMRSGSVDNCYNTGDNAHFEFSGAAGGLIGQISSPISNVPADPVIITNCHNDCDLILKAKADFGGVICRSYSSKAVVNNCYNTGNMTTMCNYTSVQGWTGIAGIVGHSEGNQSGGSLSVSFCYNTGDISTEFGFLAGIVGDGRNCSISYCFNTGCIMERLSGSTAWVDVSGITAYQSNGVSYCFNTGEIITYGYSTDNQGGVSGIGPKATHCFNAGNIYDYEIGNATVRCISRTNSTPTAYNIGQGFGFKMQVGGNSYYDKNMYPESTSSNGYTTAEMIGSNSVLKSQLQTNYWIYEEGMYPRLKWTDTCDWARDIAIAACTPIIFQTPAEDVDHVKPGMKLYGCDSNVVWKQLPQETGVQGGCLFEDLEYDIQSISCANNAIAPRLKDVCVGTTTIGTYIHDTVLVKAVTLRRYVQPIPDTLTIDNLEDLQTLQAGVNSGNAFYYKEHLLPRFADGVHFRVTADVDMQAETDWIPIGGVDFDSRFGGTVLGEGHIISNLNSTGMYAGLFGTCSGTLKDLHLTNVNISGGGYRGAICAKLLNGKVLNCTAEGSISGGVAEKQINNFYTGGLVGWSAGKDTIQNCVNRVTVNVTGEYSRSGGIVGYANTNTRVLYCYNEADIASNYRVGGIIGEGGTANYCYNTGEITGNPLCEYTGGISGYGTTVKYCYNAGIVNGLNDKYVGGISGSGSPSYCYNSNTVRSNGIQMGGIVGTGSPSYCYYDQQLCPVGGIGGTDQSNKAEGKNTVDMLSGSLLTALGNNLSIWTNVNLLYPQLTAFAGTDPSVASVMPVRLAEGETWNTVRNPFIMHGCDEGDWQLLQGNCLTLNNDLCQAVVSGSGIVRLGASVNGHIGRQVRLLVIINEDNPLVIKSLEELKNFRDVINSPLGYYCWSDSTYHTALTQTDSTHLQDFLDIREGGRDLHFKQVVDIDMSGEAGSWQPIADYQTNNEWTFRGNYNGASHTITGLTLGENKNYRGLFGYIYSGTVRNLTIDRGKMSSGGQHKGLLCGMNYGGTIDQCAVTHSKVSGSSTYTGVVCGSNYYGTVKNSHTLLDTLQSTGERAGSICGYNEYALIDSCYSDQLYMTGAGSYKGGICGYNYRSEIYHSDILNSQIDVTGTEVGGICGRNTNYSGSANDSNSPAYIQYCTNRNTTINSNNTYVGGIVGYNYYRYIYVYDCLVTGGTVTSQSNTVGGICGRQYYANSDNKVIRCVSENPVKGTSYVGGITGYCDQARIDSCENRAPVNGTTYVGGIVGYGVNYTYLTHTVNRGDVTATGDYVGGIQGNMYNNNSSRILHSYNMGRVQGTNSVGGIVGQIRHGAVQNCYNVGIVEGVSQVGGLIGGQEETVTVNSTNSYNAGWVKGTSMVGSICGYSPVNKFDNCAYDLQMCPVGGVNGVDLAATKPLLTTQLANNSNDLKNILGTTDWVYTEGMYPRLTKIDTGKAALASALPLYLTVSADDTIKANDVPVGSYNLTGCDQAVSWLRYQGYGLSITGCNLGVTGRNYVQVANKIGDDTLKVIQLVLGISEENPLEIVNLEQFRKFRDFINSNQIFYYDGVNKSFYTSPGDGYIEIQPGGENMYFKLTTNLDLRLETGGWTPIGDYASSNTLMFKGHFDGDNHIIQGLTIKNSNKSYQGLFGYLLGEVKNVKVLNAEITGAGNYRGTIAGYSKGSVMNCSSVDGRVSGGSYVGGITGYNNYAQTFYSYNNSRVTGNNYVGGIVGATVTAGVVSQCFNAGIITATNTESYVGGIVGSAATEVSNCYNTGIVGGNNRVGGIAGWSQTKWITDCYNAGMVSSQSANPTNVGAIAASDNGDYYPTNCYYDKQMSCQDGGVGNAGNQQNPTNRTTEKLTTEMVGTALSGTNGLSDTYWTFTDSLYPRLKALANCDGSIVSVQPLFISDYLKCDELELPFIVKTNDSITWTRYSTGNALNIDNIAAGKLGISICGSDTLLVQKDNDIRIVPVEVVRMAATAVVDTACDGFYVWVANGRVYTESTDVTIALTVSEGCDSIMRLNLTIPPALQITMGSKNYNCYESTDAYAEATVTGGFAQGYLYFWTDEHGDTISTTPRIDVATCGTKFGPGTYHLSVRDQVHPDCEKGTDVTITRPTELVLTPGGFDGQCYNQNDGYIEFSVAGGSMPYKVDWGTTDTMVVSRASTDTITGLAAGTYTVQAKDAHGCTKKWENVELTENTTEYAITAFGVNKMYDGVTVNPNQYILKIGEGTPDTIASGAFKVLDNGDTLRATVSYTETSVKDVRSATNEVTAFSISKNGVDQTCRYNVTTQNSNVIITKRDVILTSASAQKVYDETALTNHTVTISGSGFAAGEDTLSCTVTGSRTNAGAAANTFTYTLKENTLESNYDITIVEGQLIVGPAGQVLVIANSATKMYDGTPLTDSGYSYFFPNGRGEGDTIYVTVSGSIKNAGNEVNRIDSTSIRVKTKETGTDVTNNYAFAPVVHGTLTVTKRNVTLSTVSDSKVYDGTPLSRPTVTLSGDGFVEGEVTRYTATNSITDVGEVENTITVTTASGYLADNYNLQKSEGRLTVTKRPLTITGDSRSIDYDGQAHTLTTFAAPNLLAGHTISGLTYLATGTLTDTYTGTFTGTATITDANGIIVTDNYDIATTPGTLTIGQTILPLVVKSNSNHFRYDGQPHTYQDYTVLYNGESLSPTTGTTGYTLPTGDALTIVPQGTGATGITHVRDNADKNNAFSITLANGTNYADVTLDTGKIEIDTRLINLISKTNRKTYDGTALPFATARTDQSVERSGYGFPIGEGVVCTITGSQIDVGSSDNTFTYVASGNTDLTDYEIVPNYGTLTVDPAALTITAVDASRNYGEPNPNFQFTISGFVHGEDTTMSAPFIGTARPVLTTTADQTSVAGIYDIDVDLTGVQFTNYTVAPQSGKLTINRRPLTIQALSVPNAIYSGVEHTWEESPAPHYKLVEGTMLEHDTLTAIHISGARTIAGTTQIELDGATIEHYEVDNEGDTAWTDVTSSYDLRYLKGSLTISPYDITIKPLPFDTVFTGTTYTSAYSDAPHYEVVSGNLQGNDSIVAITISGNRASYGKTPFVINPASIKIVDTTEVHDYSDLTPEQLRNSGYRITIQTDTLTVNHRNEPYDIVINGKKDTVVYNGQDQTLSGWSLNEFEVNGFTYHVETLTSSVTKQNEGVYPTVISGDTVVKNADDEDVTAEFRVTAHPGELTISKRPMKFIAKGIDVEYDFLTHSYSENNPPYVAEGVCSNHIVSEYEMSGETSQGRVPIHITPGSVKLKITNTTTDVTDNYDITLVDSVINIRPRTNKDTVKIVSKSKTLTYDGLEHNVSGFDTLSFMLYAHDIQHTAVYFHIVDVFATSVTTSSAGVYKNVITGTPRVLDANDNDVSESFVVLADTGTLTINKRPITLTARDTNFYYDGAEHSAAQMSTPRYIINDSTQLLSGHNLVTDVTSRTISALDDTAHTKVGEVTITDAGGHYVTANYDITKVNGTLKVEGYPLKLTISSESHRFDCYNKGQKYEHYTVKYGETTCDAVEGSDYKFVLVPVTGIHDTLTITPTCAGTIAAGSSDNVENTFTYFLQNDIKYVGTRDTVYGYLTQPDTLKLTLTYDNPVCEDGSVMSFTTGGNGGNKFKLNDDADDNVGIYNHLSAGSYTVTVTDGKGCSASQSVTLTAVEATPIEGITRAGEITSYAPDTTVDASGDLTDFPALTASGEIIAQPKLSGLNATVTEQKITVSVNVVSIGVLPILEFEVSTDAGFSTTVPMYTHKVAPVTEGEQTFNFENLPTGTYYVRAKLYNCAGGQFIATPATVTEVE